MHSFFTTIKKYIRKKGERIIIPLALVAILGIGTAAFYYAKYHVLQMNPEEHARKEMMAYITDLGNLIALKLVLQTVA